MFVTLRPHKVNNMFQNLVLASLQIDQATRVFIFYYLSI